MSPSRLPLTAEHTDADVIAWAREEIARLDEIDVDDPRRDLADDLTIFWRHKLASLGVDPGFDEQCGD